MLFFGAAIVLLFSAAGFSSEFGAAGGKKSQYQIAAVTAEKKRTVSKVFVPERGLS